MKALPGTRVCLATHARQLTRRLRRCRRVITLLLPSPPLRAQFQTTAANFTVGAYEDSLNDMDKTLRKLTNSPVRGVQRAGA